MPPGSLRLDISARLPCGCPRSHFSQCTAGDFRLRYAVNLPGCTQGRHHHPEARIVLSPWAGFDSRYRQHDVGVADSAALFRPAGEDHEDRYPSPTATLALLLPAGNPAGSHKHPYVLRDTAFANLVQTMRHEMTLPDAASALVLESLALLASSRVLHQRPLEERHGSKWVTRVRERVEAECAAPPSLAELGRMVGRDAAHVAATFKRVYGDSVGTYVRQQRLWQARRRMLEEPESSLAEVALACGFTDQSHFTRQFRRLFRITPGEYRRRQGAGQGTLAQPA